MNETPTRKLIVELPDDFADLNNLLSLLSHMASNVDMFSLVHRNIHGTICILVHYMIKKKHTKQTFMTCLPKCETCLIKAWDGIRAPWRHCYSGGESCLYAVATEQLPLLEEWRWVAVILIVLTCAEPGSCWCCFLYWLRYWKNILKLIYFSRNTLNCIKLLYWVYSAHEV
jgi:hypothetical protein